MYNLCVIHERVYYMYNTRIKKTRFPDVEQILLSKAD